MSTVGSPASSCGQVLGLVAGVALDDAAPLRKPTPDAPAQLGGGLAGEGQPEHRVRGDQPVGDQPDHPGGHRLGLARAGAGDDDGGLRAAIR